MTIGQIARNQQMIYRVANRDLNGSCSTKPSSSSSKLSDYSGLLNGLGPGSAAEDDAHSFFSSPAALQGTVRQIARRLYDASFSPDANGGKSETGPAQEAYTVGGDQTLQAIRKHLGAKVESQQQLYQPDQTSLSGNFAQLQALAESLVSRLQTVSLSEETTKKIQGLALSDARNSAGLQESGEADTANASALSRKNRLDMIQEEIRKYAPSKRAAAFNTINKVWENELDRIGEYIKGKDPDWTVWGDKFDASILDDYKAGVNVWV